MKEVSRYNLICGGKYLGYYSFVNDSLYSKTNKRKMFVFIHDNSDACNPIVSLTRYVRGERELVSISYEKPMTALGLKVTYFELTDDEFLLHGVAEEI